MLDPKPVFIFGYSGHSYVIIESLIEAGYSVLGYFDRCESTPNPFNLKYCGDERLVDVKNIVKDSLVFPCIGDNSIRENIINLFEKNNLNQFILIHPSSKISKSASFGKSTYIGKNVIVNALSIVGKGVILNSGCIVEHECVIDDYSHVAPSSVLCGNVSIGKYAFIGANAVVRQNINITDNVLIGAGSVVVSDIADSGIWVGTPSKLKLS